MSRRSLIIAALVFSWIGGLFIGMAINPSIKTKETTWREERYNNECDFIRFWLGKTRNLVWSNIKERQDLGMDVYTHQIWVNDAHEVNACAQDGPYLGGWCAEGDRPCILHKLDWALAFVR